MIEVLRKRIDEVIDKERQVERNVWRIYVKAKHVLRDYEPCGYTPEEYDEYIRYISDQLQV